MEIANFLVDHAAGYDICTVATLGNPDSLQDFLAEDANMVNARGAHGIPLLYIPASHARLAAAEYLLQHGADINASSPDGITPLHGAVMFNQPRLVLWLLDHGADPNPRHVSKTPLALAPGKNLIEIVELLQSHGGRNEGSILTGECIIHQFAVCRPQ